MMYLTAVMSKPACCARPGMLCYDLQANPLLSQLALTETVQKAYGSVMSD